MSSEFRFNMVLKISDQMLKPQKYPNTFAVWRSKPSGWSFNLSHEHGSWKDFKLKKKKQKKYK